MVLEVLTSTNLEVTLSISLFEQLLWNVFFLFNYVFHDENVAAVFISIVIIAKWHCHQIGCLNDFVNLKYWK